MPKQSPLIDLPNPEPARVEIVQARTPGITAYANVGRGTFFGNPHKSNGTKANAAVVTALYLGHFATLDGRERHLKAILDRHWSGGVVRIACPCNGTFKGWACHATVIADALREMIAEREARS